MAGYYYVPDEVKEYMRKSLDKFSQKEQEELRQVAREFEQLLAEPGQHSVERSGDK